MMTLETMWRVVSTVDSQWESDLADQLVQRWHSDGKRAKYWRASANFVFFFTDHGQDYVLRFNHESERSITDVESEVSFVNDLVELGVPAANVILSKSGRFIETVETSVGDMHGVVFERVKGEQKDFEDGLTYDELRAWGRALGELHNASAKIPPKNRPSWQDQLSATSEALTDESAAVRGALNTVRAEMLRLSRDDQNFGTIHFDFELDNIIWSDGRPRPIDFDDSSSNWFAADIAFALRDLSGDDARKIDLDNPSLKRFVDGYRSARPIADDELQTLPLFMRFHHLVTLGRLKHCLTPAATNEPDWMAELRVKLAGVADHYRSVLTD